MSVGCSPPLGYIRGFRRSFQDRMSAQPGFILCPPTKQCSALLYTLYSAHQPNSVLLYTLYSAHPLNSALLCFILYTFPTKQTVLCFILYTLPAANNFALHCHLLSDLHSVVVLYTLLYFACRFYTLPVNSLYSAYPHNTTALHNAIYFILHSFFYCAG